MPFVDRTEAGRKLAKALVRYKDQRPVVLALPRGGVPVAAEVAAALDAPLDLILVRKIGVPFQPELAMGAVVDGIEPVTVRNEEVIRLAGVSEQEFNAIRDQQLAEIERRRKLYLGDRPHPPLSGRTIIVIDDGIATGATIARRVAGQPLAQTEQACARYSRCANRFIGELRGEADEIVCLEDYEEFWRDRTFLFRLPPSFRRGSDRATGPPSCQISSRTGLRQQQGRRYV